MKCILQIVLAERLILLGKDPSEILCCDLDRGYEFIMKNYDEQKQAMELYIDKLLYMYGDILH
jgi:hypothetical protein